MKIEMNQGTITLQSETTPEALKMFGFYSENKSRGGRPAASPTREKRKYTRRFSTTVGKNGLRRKYKWKECPTCGEMHKNLGAHMRIVHDEKWLTHPANPKNSKQPVRSHPDLIEA